MIRFACPSCGAVFTAADEKGGKTATCAKCQAHFILPEAFSPPPPPPLPTAPAPMARVVRTAPPAPAWSPQDEPAPRRRPPLHRDEVDDYDDRPRRRRDRDDDEDYDDEDLPRKKKAPRKSGVIMALGIVCIIAAVAMALEAIITMNDALNFSTSGRFTGGGFGSSRPTLPTQVEIALVFFQIAVYGTIVTSLVYLGGGIGLVLYQVAGRVTTIIAASCGAFMIFSTIMYSLLVLTFSPEGRGSYSPSASDIFRVLFRIVLQAVPIIFASVTLFNIRHTKCLRVGF